MTTTERELIVDDVNGVRVLSLNRPDRLNAFTSQGYFALAQAMNDAAADSSVQVVLLKGEGRAYCAGVDLFALGEATGDEFSQGIKAAVLALATFPKPIVAAVHGAIVGFGATMLLHVDVVLTAEDARWRFPFTELGTGPEAGSSFMLPKIVGERRATELLMTSRWVSGQEAAELGLATDAVPSDQVHRMGQLVAEKLTTLKGPALVETKALMRRGWAEEIAQAVDRETAVAGEITRNLGGSGFAWEASKGSV